MNRSVKYVGLDYHQHSIQVCVMNAAGDVILNVSCPNDAGALAKCVGPGQVHAALEACGGAADLADELASRKDWSVALAHPGYVARLKQSPDKTDYSDARMLADLQRVGYLPRVWLAPGWIRDLRALVGYRQSLVKQLTATKLRIRALLREARIKPAAGLNAWTRPWLHWLRHIAPLEDQARWIVEQHLDELQTLQRRIYQVGKRLEQATAEDPVVARLLSFKGIGRVTACVMRAAIGRFDRFRSGKQLARFCGLSPRNASSGQRQADAGLIHTCNRYLRATIIEAAHRLRRFDPECAKRMRELQARGKPYNVAIAAVANRWLRRLFHQMRPLGLAPANAN